MRPPALDEFKRREVLALLAHGVSRRAAADYVDCAPNTILNAFRGDEAFRAAVLKAEAGCETHCLGRHPRGRREALAGSRLVPRKTLPPPLRQARLCANSPCAVRILSLSAVRSITPLPSAGEGTAVRGRAGGCHGCVGRAKCRRR